MAWIHKDDAAAALIHLIKTPTIDGPINVVAEPVRNAEFTKALGKVLKRPTLFPVPPIALNVLFGRGTAEELLMASQRVSPQRLIASGFQHRYPTIAGALAAALA
jgi:NAD dependent epimerase/dehydratase family enzyme